MIGSRFHNSWLCKEFVLPCKHQTRYEWTERPVILRKRKVKIAMHRVIVDPQLVFRDSSFHGFNEERWPHIEFRLSVGRTQVESELKSFSDGFRND